MMNEMRTLLYRAMARFYPPERESRAFHWLARTAEFVLGKATATVGGVKVRLGPADLLDRFLLLGRNLNPLFVSACKPVHRPGRRRDRRGCWRQCRHFVCSGSPGIRL